MLIWIYSDFHDSLQTCAIKKRTLGLVSLVSSFLFTVFLSCQAGPSAVCQKYACIYDKMHWQRVIYFVVWLEGRSQMDPHKTHLSWHICGQHGMKYVRRRQGYKALIKLKEVCSVKSKQLLFCWSTLKNWFFSTSKKTSQPACTLSLYSTNSTAVSTGLHLVFTHLDITAPTL